MKKSIPGKTTKEAVSEKSRSGSGDSGLPGLLDGRFGADHPVGEEMCSVGRKWVYIFNRRMAKKLIPDQANHRDDQSEPRCQRKKGHGDLSLNRWSSRRMILREGRVEIGNSP